MIKIQDLINIGGYEVSDEAVDTLTYVCEDYSPEDLASKEKIKAKIKVKVKYAIEHDYQAYEYLKDRPRDYGNFEEAIKAGETDVIGIARFYLIKELYEKLEEISGE